MRSLKIAGVGVCLLLGALWVNAEKITVATSGGSDGYIRDLGNDGSGDVIVHLGNSLFVGTTLDDTRRSVIIFELPFLEEGETIESATLKVKRLSRGTADKKTYSDLYHMQEVNVNQVQTESVWCEG